MTMIRVTGGLIDATPNIAGNIGLSSLAAGNANTGNNTYASRPPTTPHDSVSNPVIGDWFRVPDQSIRGEYKTGIGVGTGSVVKYWRPMEGMGEIRLSDSEFQGTYDILNIFRTGNLTYSNCSIKYTPNTRAGLVAIGAIPSSTPVPPSVTEPDAPATTADAIVSGSTAIVVLAIVGAAIWFLPKNLVRG